MSKETSDTDTTTAAFQRRTRDAKIKQARRARAAANPDRGRRAFMEARAELEQVLNKERKPW